MTLKVWIVSGQMLLAQMAEIALEKFERKFETSLVIVEYNQDFDSLEIPSDCPDLVVLSLGLASNGFQFAHHLNAKGCQAPILAVCTPFALPTLEELTLNGIQGILLTTVDLTELEKAIYQIVDSQPGILEKQYLQAIQKLDYLPSNDFLSEKEIQILQIVATDLTDLEIGNQLDLSPSTIRNHLGRIYSKPGVKSRVGAVLKVLRRGLINWP